MTLAKKGRRDLTVGGVLYHYKVTSICREPRVIVQNTETGKKFQWHNLHECSVTPGFVESLVNCFNNGLDPKYGFLNKA